MKLERLCGWVEGVLEYGWMDGLMGGLIMKVTVSNAHVDVINYIRMWECVWLYEKNVGFRLGM